MGKGLYIIQLDNQQGVFYPGQVVAGRVELQLEKETKARAIYLDFHGYANVHWTESTQSNNGSHTSHYTNDETYFRQKISLFGKEQSGQDETKLQPGSYAYPFAIQLPPNIPSSYEADIGRVRYRLKSYIDIPWGFDKKTKRMITVVNLFDLNTKPETANGATCSDQKTLCCLCCESDPISATVTIDRTGYVPGEAVSFRAEINNQSTREMSCSKAQLNMVVSYHAQSKTRDVTNILNELRHGKIEGGGTDQWSNERLHIPAVPPSYLLGCNIIDIKYFLNIVVDPSGIGFALNVPVEVVIGSIPLATIAQQHGFVLPTAPTAPLPQQGLNPNPKPAFPLQSAAPSGLYGDAFIPQNQPNVTMAESAFGRMSTKEDDDTQDTSGATDFAPVYTYYNWDKPDPNNTFSIHKGNVTN
ncbi:hypothetical protein ACF0H5_011989 [Mactra antiquata]